MIQKRTIWLVPIMTAVAWLIDSDISLAQQAITFVGQTVDQTDFQALGFGQTGYYFPQFGGSNPTTEKPADDNMQLTVPSWLGFQFDISQSDRTFSPDAGLIDPGPPVVFGVYSEGGKSTWNTFTLPDGSTGRSGSVVDLATADNSNNTVNRIQLGSGVPSTFLMRVVVDNTNLEHDPISRLSARGDSNNGGGFDLREQLSNLTVNGTTDVYTFRYDNFVAGDYIKIQLNSGDPSKAAGFGGLMFDVIPDADFDQDSEVDGFDFLAWQRGFGTDVGSGNAAPFADGNANGDQFIDDADFAIWEKQFGDTGPAVAALSTPEPSTLFLAMFAGCVVLQRRQQI